jgi:hypothetical protein
MAIPYFSKKKLFTDERIGGGITFPMKTFYFAPCFNLRKQKPE